MRADTRTTMYSKELSVDPPVIVFDSSLLVGIDQASRDLERSRRFRSAGPCSAMWRGHQSCWQACYTVVSSQMKERVT